MKKNFKLNVKGVSISMVSIKTEDYLSLTDIVKPYENGLSIIEKWLRNKNTIEFLGVWEQLNNDIFNSPEFEGIDQCERLRQLNETGRTQLISLLGIKGVKKLSPETELE